MVSDGASAVRGRRADSTPGDSRCEEKSRGKIGQAEWAGCHVAPFAHSACCPSSQCCIRVQFPRRMTSVEYWAFRVGRVPKRPKVLSACKSQDSPKQKSRGVQLAVDPAFCCLILRSVATGGSA